MTLEMATQSMNPCYKRCLYWLQALSLPSLLLEAVKSKEARRSVSKVLDAKPFAPRFWGRFLS